MHADKGVITSRGGMASHVANIARDMGAHGRKEMAINSEKKTDLFGNKDLKEIDYISKSGDSSEIYEGQAAIIEPQISGDL